MPCCRPSSTKPSRASCDQPPDLAPIHAPSHNSLSPSRLTVSARHPWYAKNLAYDDGTGVAGRFPACRFVSWGGGLAGVRFGFGMWISSLPQMPWGAMRVELQAVGGNCGRLH